MTLETCRTNVISDEPRTEDAFEGKGHDRLSKAVVDLITHSEEGGKVIGLEGDWGSGKSTVIKLVEKGLLEANDDIAFILFDAWAHQGDPLKRAFLETCIDELESKKWIDNTTWDNAKDELAKRSKKTKTDTSSRLTFLGGLLAFTFVILVPLGPLLINASYQQGSIDILGSPVSPTSLFSSGFLLTLSPLIVFVVWIVLYSLFRKIFQILEKSPFRKLATWASRISKAQFSRSDIFALLAQRYDTTTTTFTTETVDPTSIEFEQKFRDLLSEALAHQNRKVVLVLDNLDRTFNDDARSILANMQTFFQHKQGQGVSEFRRTWILIPYDRRGFEAIWKGVNSTGTDHSNEGHAAVVFSDSMLHKRFHLIFPVPPLVVSDLKTYLLSLLSDAFPGHQDEDEFHLVYQVTRAAWKTASYKTVKHDISKATPRELVSLVNRIGAIHRQWCPTIPLSHIAFYACRRFLCPDEQIDQKLINKGEFPPSEILLLLGEELRDHLAALWFNVPVEIARQILYQDRVIESLKTERGATELAELSDRTPKLWSVIAEVANEFQHHLLSLEVCLNAAVALGNEKVRAIAPQAEYRKVFDSLISTLLKIDTWGPIDKAMAEKFIELLNIRSDPALPPFACKLFSVGHGKSAGELYAVETVSGWVDALLVLWPVIEGQVGSLSGGKLAIPADGPGYLKAFSLLHQEDAEETILPWIGLPENLAELQDSMVKSIDAGNFRVEDIGQIGYISRSPEGSTFEWRTVFLRIAERLKAIAKNNPLTEDTIGLLKAISQIRLISNSSNLPGAKDYRALVIDGTLYHFVDRFQEEESYSSLGSTLSLLVQIQPELTSPAEGAIGRWREGHSYVQNSLFGDPSNHPEVIVELCRDLASIGKTSLLDELWAKNSASRKLVSACYLEISKLEQEETRDSKFVIENWRDIRTSMDKEWGNYVEYLVARTSLLKDIVEKDEPVTDDFTVLVDWLLAKGANSDREFVAWIRNQLVARIEGEWLNALQSDNGWISLLVRFREKKLGLNLEIDFQKALLIFAEQLAGGASPPKKDPERWALLFGCFGKNKHHRSVLKRDIWRKLMARDGDIGEPFFSYFGEELVDPEMIRENRNSVEQVFRPLLERDSGTGLKWLLSLLNRHPKLLEGYEPEDAVLDFKDRIRKALVDSQSDHLDTIKSLAATLGVEPPPELPAKEFEENLE